MDVNYFLTPLAKGRTGGVPRYGATLTATLFIVVFTMSTCDDLGTWFGGPNRVYYLYSVMWIVITKVERSNKENLISYPFQQVLLKK